MYTYIHTYLHTYICIYIHTYIHIHMVVGARTCSNAYILTYIFSHTSNLALYVSVRVCTQTHTCHTTRVFSQSIAGTRSLHGYREPCMHDQGKQPNGSLPYGSVFICIYIYIYIHTHIFAQAYSCMEIEIPVCTIII